jgi:(2S)-methylsuccinyl-CoA dehydrogenase
MAMANPQRAPGTPASAIDLTAGAAAAAERLLALAKPKVKALVAAKGADAVQHAAHGLAWLATYVEALRQLAAWGRALSDAGRYGRMEELILLLGA